MNTSGSAPAPLAAATAGSEATSGSSRSRHLPVAGSQRTSAIALRRRAAAASNRATMDEATAPAAARSSPSSTSLPLSLALTRQLLPALPNFSAAAAAAASTSGTSGTTYGTGTPGGTGDAGCARPVAVGLGRLLLDRHLQLHGGLQVVPQRLHGALLLLGGGEVAGQEHLQHRLDLARVGVAAVRGDAAVRGVQQQLACAHAVEPQQRRGVLQRPLHLAPLLHVVHPDHGALLVRLSDRPLPAQQRDLAADLAVRQRHRVVHAVRRAGGDE
mmetsp:Transcript_35249/g.86493  ORF Transcript_35249/g.86493 Transcript_35249/m.86493 type:complete len:272 (+) Transcript_35249:242-1057(+)